jgi:outer membrane protein OmpA-like peptidoglycan-associated protein
MSKDTTITVLTNHGKKLLIDSVGIINGNRSVISIVDNKEFTLKKGQSKNLTFRFSPIQRGVTTTTLHFYTSQSQEVLTSTIIAEGVAPREYIVRVTTLNKLTKQPIMTWVTFPEHHSYQEKTPTTWTSDEGIETVKVKADREYTFKANLNGYISDSIYLDLRTPPGSDTIDLLLQITPVENTNVVEHAVWVSGEHRNFESNQLLSGSVECYLNDSLIATSNASRGTYNVILAPNKTYQFIAQSNDYLPTSATLSTFTDPTEYQQDFLLSQVITGQDIQLDNVLFDRGKAKLLSSSYDALDMLVKYLMGHPKSKIELSGHTDNQGNKKLNLQLSKDRVAVISDYMIKKGIAEGRISGTGYGDTKPIASNAGEKTRKLNRRVEFKIIE